VSAIASTIARTLAVRWTLPIDTAARPIFHQFHQPPSLPVRSTPIPGMHIGIMMNRRFLADANELCRLGVADHGGFQLGKVYAPRGGAATLARAEQVQERFNAFSLIDTDAALAIAKESTARWRSGAPLSGIDGVPTTIKDIVWVKDWTVTYGAPQLLQNRLPSGTSASQLGIASPHSHRCGPNRRKKSRTFD
jgi:Asp-tRNA(Asn)/Glu-tRNA(Gln) amidotransferase A subunit family amidase